MTAGTSFGTAFSRSWVTNNGRTKYSCNHTLVVRNTADQPFEPGHTYAAFITTGLESATGAPLGPDADFTAVMGATRPTDAALGHAWDAYLPLRNYLTSKGADAPVLATAAVFTVQDAPGHVARLAANVATQPPPALTALTLCGPGVTSPCDDGTPARACPTVEDDRFAELHGKFSVPIYQTGTAPYEAPAQGGAIVETSGLPTLVRTDQVCFALTIPKTVPLPATGWPLVVYHHGTGGSMRSFVSDGVAKELAAMTRPAAGFSFDAVEHGARKGGSTKKPDDLVFNPLNPRAARDNFLQGAVDILQALRVSAVSVTATSSPTGVAMVFDPDKVAFFGHSQGSTSGELAIALSDTAGAAVFSGAGAYLTASLLDKTMPVNISTGMEFLIGEPLDAEHPVMTLFQSFFDRSDPLSYNPLIITPAARADPVEARVHVVGHGRHVHAALDAGGERALARCVAGRPAERGVRRRSDCAPGTLNQAAATASCAPAPSSSTSPAAPTGTSSPARTRRRSATGPPSCSRSSRQGRR